MDTRDGGARVAAYQQQLVGPVPQFPREIEERIVDQYLMRQAGPQAERESPPPHL